MIDCDRERKYRNEDPRSSSSRVNYRSILGTVQSDRETVIGKKKKKKKKGRNSLSCIERRYELNEGGPSVVFFSFFRGSST